jgi:hypothetical protein
LADATVCTFCRRDVKPPKSRIPSTSEIAPSDPDRKLGAALAERIEREMAARRDNVER